MNKYQTQAGDILRVYPEEDTCSIAFSLKSPLPADKHICYFELDTESARHMAEYVRGDILMEFIEDPSKIEPALRKLLQDTINEYYEGKKDEH